MTVNAHIRDASEADVRKLAEIVALKLQPGDVIALHGDLGTGKTTFARALIRAFLADPEREVASPTFSLVQPYDAGRFPIAHLDLYRLTDPGDVLELGLEDILRSGALLIEWPDRLGADILSDASLHLKFSDGSTAALRNLSGTGFGSWKGRLQRALALDAFLNAQPSWAGCRLTHSQGDASTRSYARLVGGPSPALLMDAPPEPTGVTDGKAAYANEARLARDMRPFVAVAHGLDEAGITVPKLHATDLDSGFLIVQDLGSTAFGQALADGVNQNELWQAATDVLIALHDDVPDHTWTFSDDVQYRLPVFSADVMRTEAQLLLDYYWPHVHDGEMPDPSVREAFREITDPVFRTAAQSNRHWVLRDFHSPNLIWRPQHSGLARVGVIDFQDALRGPAEYDLVSLLQDARVDVEEALEHSLLERYTAAIIPRGETTEAGIRLRYATLGTQRALKILGIFARLADRDGKPAYLAHVPRIWRYLEHNLKHPSLADLRSWLDRHFAPSHRVVTMAETRR